MAQIPDITREKVLKFYHKVKEFYPVKRVLLYGSYAKGRATADSDIDVAVVMDMPDHLKRIEITAELFSLAGNIDTAIEPKCIFWDEYRNCEQASILSEIITTGIEIA